MEFLASLVVHKPFNILIVAVAFVLGYVVRRFAFDGTPIQTRALLVATVVWVLYAAWEWLVMTRTPEANIRVDLMLIWPVLLGLSAWAIFRALR